MVPGTGKEMKLFSYALILSLALASCGCISFGSSLFEKNQSQFAAGINASQGYYDNLVRDDALNATAWCIRGNYYNNAFNQYDTALQSYNRSLELDPGYGYAWFSKGVTLQNMGYYNESKQCFEKALRYDPTLNSVIARQGNG
jgi:tetratricopeptide (TPR) repeat protein